MNGRVFNEIPSPVDERDWKWESIVQGSDKKLPKEFDLRPYCQPVRSQGSRGTCAAFTASAIKEYQETVQSDWKGYMSPNSVYFYRSTKPGSGMYGRNVMEILKNQGICTENYFPYTKDEPESIPKKAVEEMKHFKISSYAKVTTIEGCKTSLYKNGPLYISFPVYRNGTTQFWKPLKQGEKSVGGHAVAIVGWTKDSFIIRNSWGDGWADDGHVLYPFKDFGCHYEIWTTIDADTNYTPPKKSILCC
jgi:C1A family cysteine protease